MSRLLLALVLTTCLAASALADDVVRLTGRQLAAQVGELQGKMVETSGTCHYAGVNAYSCSVPGFSRIDFSRMEPETARKALELNCDSQMKLVKLPCKTRFRFVFEGHDVQPDKSGRKVTVVKARDLVGTIVP
jgi:hypothetical protein